MRRRIASGALAQAVQGLREDGGAIGVAAALLHVREVRLVRLDARRGGRVQLVLLHKGKGGGLSDLFGGGVSSTLGSSSVVERNLDRITIFFGVLWFVCIIALNLVINH